jgi:predicted transcriptional regulator
MGELKPADPFASNEEEVEVDEETLAAIDRGIKAADEGRSVPLEEVRKMIPEWIAKFESRKRR